MYRTTPSLLLLLLLSVLGAFWSPVALGFSVGGPAAKFSARRGVWTRATVRKFPSFEKCIETVGVENGKNLVVVDFYATWCGPCEDMAVILEEIAEEMEEKVAVVKVDTDKYPTLTDRYYINGFPTLVMMKSGNEVDRIVGMASKEELVKKIDELAAEP